jgi:MYXO-CTERM domain-containing protein
MMQLKFELKSDSGLQLGGWTIDDVCVVATAAAHPAATCGDGTVDTGETCDDGNTTDGDGCSSTCQDETGTGPGKDAGGCCSIGGSPAGPLGLGLLTLGLVFRRRRRR